MCVTWTCRNAWRFILYIFWVDIWHWCHSNLKIVGKVWLPATKGHQNGQFFEMGPLGFVLTGIHCRCCSRSWEYCFRSSRMQLWGGLGFAWVSNSLPAGQWFSNCSCIFLYPTRTDLFCQFLTCVPVPVDYHSVWSIHRLVWVDTFYINMDLWPSFFSSNAIANHSEDCNRTGFLCNCNYFGSCNTNTSPC